MCSTSNLAEDLVEGFLRLDVFVADSFVKRMSAGPLQIGPQKNYVAAPLDGPSLGVIHQHPPDSESAA